MFSSLSTTLGLPFLSASEDDQLAFKGGKNGIKRLWSSEVIANNEQEVARYWSQYWNLFEKEADVWALVSVADVRNALTHNPQNLHTLITVISTHLFSLVTSDRPQFPDPTCTRQALNCIRVLGRIIAVLFEQASSSSSQHANAADVLWEPLGTDSSEATLADRLFGCTIDLMFCAGFTLPEQVLGEEGEKVNYVIWSRGIGSTHGITTTPPLERHKSELLRFLLVLVSSTAYTAPHALPHATNRPLRKLTHGLERRLVLCLLCSWLNTSFAASASSANAGGITLPSLPYTHLVSKAGDERRNLVRLSLMCLLVALDRWDESPAIRSGNDAVTSGGESLPQSPGGGGGGGGGGDEGNSFRYFITKLHRKEDFDFLLTGLCNVLVEHTSTRGVVLPGSRKPIPYLTEICLMLWRLVDLNKRFRQYICESSSSSSSSSSSAGRLAELVTHLLVCALDAKDDAYQHGLVRMLCYILQTLSSDRSFGPTLAEAPLDSQHVPARWLTSGTTVDFLVVSLYSIATAPGLNAVLPAVTITISNIAPHIRGLGVQASTRLVQLFKSFATPSFLLADEAHPRLVYYVLETFNLVLQYQLGSNPNLVYAILCAHTDFQRLATFTLAQGLREIQRRNAAREQQRSVATSLHDPNLPEKPNDLLEPASARRHSDAATSPLLTPGEAEEDPLASAESNADRQRRTPMSEKARGKMRERSDSESVASIALGTGDSAAATMMDVELQRLAMSGIGPNGFVPTQEWVTSWQKGLPLDPVLLAISELLPRVRELQKATTPGPSKAVMDFLRGASLVDVLPSSQTPFSPRKFQWSIASSIWLTSLLWGDIYVALLPIFAGTNVRLFGVKQAAPSRREQALRNVGSKLMSFVGSNGNGSMNGE